jgi:hypothetical protein
MFQYETWSKTQSMSNFKCLFFFFFFFFFHVFFPFHFKNEIAFKIIIRSKFNSNLTQIK